MFKKIVFLLAIVCSMAFSANIKDILDREVVVKDSPDRIILTFYFEEYFAAAKQDDAFKKIVGWSRKYWEGRAQATWEAFLDKFPQIDKIPDVGYIGANALSVEKIISLKPDVVVFAKIDYGKLKPVLEQLSKAKIPAVFVDFHDQELQTHLKSMQILGKVLGTEQKVKEIEEFYLLQYNLVMDRLAKEQNLQKPKVYLEFSEKEGVNQIGLTWDEKMWGNILKLTGGENIAKGLVKGTAARLNPELIIAKNPDIIIITGNYFAGSFKNVRLGYGISEKEARENLAKYTKRDGWNSINAVKNNKIYAINHDLSRHIFDFAGFLFFAKVMHPKLFADVDPNIALEEFFDKFYPVKYNGTWMVF